MGSLVFRRLPEEQKQAEAAAKAKAEEEAADDRKNFRRIIYSNQFLVLVVSHGYLLLYLAEMRLMRWNDRPCLQRARTAAEFLNVSDSSLRAERQEV